jgi:hypothetical protein
MALQVRIWSLGNELGQGARILHKEIQSLQQNASNIACISAPSSHNEESKAITIILAKIRIDVMHEDTGDGSTS